MEYEQAYRKYVKEFKEQLDKEDKTLSDFTKVTARGFMVVCVDW